jgi:hypothetical protein
MEIKPIKIRVIPDIPEVLFWTILYPKSLLVILFQLVVNIGFPVVDMPGCVEHENGKLMTSAG